VTAAIVALITVAGFKQQILADNVLVYKHIDYCWRILIGFGCVPGAIALYFRLTIPETPRYTMDIERNVKQASQDVDTYLTTGTYVIDPDAPIMRVDAPKASRRDFIRHFSQWKNGKVLFGCAWSWFALDIAFYGLGLNSSTILSTIGFGAPATGTPQHKVWQNLYNVSVGNIILSVGGLIPGYWFSFAFIDFWGRKPIQLMGFVLLTIIFCCMGFGYDKMLSTSSGKKAFVFLYCMANFFQNFGPNTTTFVIPGEVFPTRYRSTAHGISAASGKLGAIVAREFFLLPRSFWSFPPTVC
jgi:MFS transporter, PHS family, inorganic phosphate transporter